jgi:hypothetical protein
MIAQYVEAVYRALGSVVDLVTRLALPLAVCVGVVALAIILTAQRTGASLPRTDWRRSSTHWLGFLAVGLIAVAGWAALRTMLPLAREDIRWREAAEATTNPVPDAPAAYQYGPSLAAVVERTYTRTLTLPPDFVDRIGTQGVGVLAPYLSDPSAENVLKLVDTFRRSGQDVVFTRQVTRLDEDPIPFTKSQVRVKFRRLAGRAYDTEFEGRYAFENSSDQPIDARFLFPLPQAGTVRDLNVNVGGQAVTEPGRTGANEWKGRMAAGERREAVVRYRVLGARSWHYDLGSRRRRVQEFHLEAETGGPVRFLRGSIQPTVTSGNRLQWELPNVVTEQQVAMAFPPDTVGRQCYLQALSALPAALIVFLVGVLAIGWRLRHKAVPASLAAGLVLFALGLGAAAVLANYVGPVAAMIVGPLVGALLAVRVLGRPALVTAIPAALLPATFLSPHHTGLLVLLLAFLNLAGIVIAPRPGERWV